MNFDKEAKADKKQFGEGGGGALKPKQQTASNEVNTKMQKCNYLHNVEHVVQSTFQNTLISF